jgi:Bacterial-like globin
MIDDLYDLIGGRHTVWAATESFYRKVFANEILRPFFETSDTAQPRAPLLILSIGATSIRFPSPVLSGKTGVRLLGIS